MRRNLISQSRQFAPRALVAFVFCATGVFLVMLSIARTIPAESAKPSLANVVVVSSAVGSCPGKAPNGAGLTDGFSAIVTPVGAATFAAAQQPKFAEPNAAGATDWQQISFVSRPPTPPVRDGGANTYDEARSVVVLFGGRNYEYVNGNWVFSQLGDTWTWDGKTWTEKHPAHSPPARVWTDMAYNPAIGKTILFGGQTCSGGLCSVWLNDTWAWDGNDWTQLTPATAPPPRNSTSLTYDPALQQLVLFGGITSCCPAVFAGDTWLFDGTNWTQATPANSPSARYGDNSLMTYVPANNGIILFGGRDSSGQKDDTWLWDGTNWSQLTPSTSPPASFDPTIVYYPPTSTAVLYLYEGDTWTWNGSNWARANVVSPPPRYGSVYVYDAAIAKVVMYSGTECLPDYDDQWLWDGTLWTQIDLGDKFPPQRTYAGMSFDTTRNQSVMFSGVREGCSFLWDTWTWNGANWKWIHSPNNPAPRAWTTMAYDPDHAVTVLFGGRRYDGRDLNDTWVFDGQRWIQQFPAQEPVAREAAAMAFDAVSHKIVLFAGYNGTQLSDTWSWDGTNWTQEQPTTSPPGRIYYNMTRDAQGQPVFFGGADVAGNVEPIALNDTWRWNGSSHDWEPLAPGPGARFAAGMGYDGRSQSVILFGGSLSSFGGNLNDTWAFDGTLWQPLIPATSPAARAWPAMSDGSLTNPPVLMGGSAMMIMGDAWTWGIPTPQVQLNAVVSRKVHGSAGPFDLDLPISGSAGVECRSAGANGDYTLIFTFANPLTDVGDVNASASGGGPAPGATGMIDNADAHRYIVSLSNVPNAQYTTVNLTNVTDSVGNFSASIQTTMGVLLGDVNGDGQVDSSDLLKVKQQVLQPVNDNPGTSNFREDVNTDGNLDSGDLLITKRQALTGLP
jgi:Dockerin type I domain